VLSTGLQRLGHTILGVAVLASITAPAPARAPAAAAPRTLRGSHGTAPAAWLAAEQVYAEVDRRARTLDAPVRTKVARAILSEAARAGLDPLLVLAVIHVESSFDPGAVSKVGAAGLMQLLESTMGEVHARSGGIASTNPLDPVANVQAGVRYLGTLFKTFKDAELALMAYNAGPGRIRHYLREGGVPARFWAFPRSIARELGRLGGGLMDAELRVGAMLASNDATPRGSASDRGAGSPRTTGPDVRSRGDSPSTSGAGALGLGATFGSRIGAVSSGVAIALQM
jgi:soluble lytic murein transglycosylase-like protein